MPGGDCEPQSVRRATSLICRGRTGGICMNTFASSVLGCAVLVAYIPALAADLYPSRPIRIVVAYTPAGTTDILARVLGQKLTEWWGHPGLIDTRPGANGNIGTEYAAKATPDGYTLLMTTAGPHGINPSLYRKLGYDAVKDFAPVSLVAIVPNILVVNNSIPVKDVRELIAYAKANPGKLNYGSPGNGSTAHLSMELFKSMTGTQMVHVPYKGSAGVLADLIGGQIAAALGQMPAYLPQGEAGENRSRAARPARPAPPGPALSTGLASGSEIAARRSEEQGPAKRGTGAPRAGMRP